MLNRVKKYIKNKFHKLYIDFISYRIKIVKKNELISNKNIMILVSRLYNGGAEKIASNLADELSKKYNVILVTKHDKNKLDYKCSVPRIVLNQKEENDNSFIYILKLIKQLKKIKKENNIGHCISFCTIMNYLNVMSKVNDEVIISIRNYLSESEKDEKHTYMNMKSAKYSDKIVVVSKILEKEQIEKYKAKREKVFVINNFCDSDKIEYILNHDKSEINFNDDNIVSNIGRLSYQKGQIHLINAFRKVVDKIPDAKLLILGQGDLKDSLENRINNLNLNNNVFLLSFQYNPYIYLKNSKVFVLSSFYEGMSNAILEAMYCNLPIISTDCKAGTREILAPDTNLDLYNKEVTKEKYGILVPILKSEYEENLLADTIIGILEDKNLQYKYRKLSGERIKDFSKEIIIQKWIEVIKK